MLHALEVGVAAQRLGGHALGVRVLLARAQPRDEHVGPHARVAAVELAQRALKTSGLACVAPALLPVEVRPAAVSAFVNEPAVGVCLLTLDHAQSAGLTLTVASTVVLLDPVLDTSIEDQAIARVHRIGQSVPVTAIRLCQGWCPASSDDPSLRWRGLDVIDANEDPAAIEAKIGSGQIEELVAQAKDELGLIPKMKEWKPWEFSHTIRMEDESKQPSEDK